MTTAKLISLQIGMPKTYGEPGEKPWTTGIYKEPVGEPVWLGVTHLDGDSPANQKAHGGPDKAVNAYPSEHYPYWQAEFNLSGVDYGRFGENFTTQGLVEDEVCIGDTFRVGEAVVQVSQPRQPCGTLARRWGITDFVERVNRAGMTGWYFRVLQEGLVQAGDILEFIERPYPDWSVSRANQVSALPKFDLGVTRSLIACPGLSAAWQEGLSRRIDGL